VFLRIVNQTGGVRKVYIRPADITYALSDNTDATLGLSPVWVESSRCAYTIMVTDASGNLAMKCDAAVTGLIIIMHAYVKLS